MLVRNPSVIDNLMLKGIIAIIIGVIEAEADHLDAVTTVADHVLTMKIVLTGGIMEEVEEEIEEIEVVTAITVVLDPQWVVESVTITITWVAATVTTIEEVVVEEQMPP